MRCIGAGWGSHPSGIGLRMEGKGQGEGRKPDGIGEVHIGAVGYSVNIRLRG